MSEYNDHSVFFTDGHVISRTKVAIAAKLNDMAEADFSRVLYYLNGVWTHWDIRDSVNSVTYTTDPEKCHWLGQNGTVTVAGSGRVDTESIPDARRYGALNRIQAIGNHLYVCGYGGQVHQKSGGTWRHLDSGILVPSPDASSVELLDIDGTADDDIYTVGTGGALYYFDGQQWTVLDSPTNVHLLGVRCIRRDEVYVCGYRGSLFRGDKNGWTNLSDPEILNTFWDLEWYQEKVYLALNERLMTWDGKGFAPVDMGVDGPISCHRLHANDGVLWSFGE